MSLLTKEYIQNLCDMHEDVFTKDILKPLFESMGYDRVDFNGGPYERGKDLIAQRYIPPQKEPYVVYVQSKKIGSIQNTTTAAKYSQLLHQLRQCITSGITNIDGQRLYASEVYLACPEQMTNRFLEELNTQLSPAQHNVNAIDGPAIISLIKEHNPELLDKLTTFKDKLKSGPSLTAPNTELLSALKSNNEAELKHFYSDLSFFVGSVDSNRLLHLDVAFSREKLHVEEESWSSFKEQSSEISEKYKIQLFKELTSTIEKKFNADKKRFLSKKNQTLESQITSLDSEINNASHTIDSRIKALDTSINAPSHSSSSKSSPEEKTNLRNILSYLRTNPNVETSPPPQELNSINTYQQEEVGLILTIITSKIKLEALISTKKNQLVKKPTYFIQLNCDAITNFIKENKSSYFKDVELINNRELNAFQLKDFLSRTQRTLAFINTLIHKDFLLSKTINFKEIDYQEDRVSISPYDIFYTKHDIAVYGGAGVGKTTTLFTYAQALPNDTFFYIRLNSLIEQLKGLTQSSPNPKQFQTDLLIKIILLSKGLEPLVENIVTIKKALSNYQVLILDGLDEIHSAIPEIIQAISDFKLTYPSSQLIISSRDCVSYLNKIDFLGITLLPFTKDQLHKFISGWFTDEAVAIKLIASIKLRNLYECVQTPLLATIMCDLVEKGINAPSTEHEIYSERVNLLTGEYDQHKNIKRQKQKGTLLRECARKIAFCMHMKNTRNLSFQAIIEQLVFSLKESHNESLLLQCLNELINPCNILTLDPMTSTYSFGHTRFQEHLASEEIKFNRSIEITDLITSEWWRGTLALYAQNNDFSSLIEDCYKKHGDVSKASMTIKTMIDNSPNSKRAYLKELLESYEEADDFERSVLNDYDAGYDAGYDASYDDLYN